MGKSLQKNNKKRWVNRSRKMGAFSPIGARVKKIKKFTKGCQGERRYLRGRWLMTP
ncbi:hypothetical protein ETAE_2131 [Edwardsiella piscicida]|uniref:Uncharacterized protein n=1 Tax=Edwardsiella piscicida TaxID=1263550 RepID=A0AAU8P4B8_EDWPI|nr:hypothetical protein ETAE_2131 [Edwardsiella tarda EIB202]